MAATKEETFKAAADAAFGHRLVSNMYRGLIAEAIVKSALDSGWNWCSADWAGWDFEHSSSCKLEVKQTAAVQTWEKGSSRISRTIFGIPASSGFYEGAKWIEKAGRQADVYVFAHHSIDDRQIADHRDPTQWAFYVLPTRSLPAAQTISIATLRSICVSAWSVINYERAFPCGIDDLGMVVEAVRQHQL